MPPDSTTSGLSRSADAVGKEHAMCIGHPKVVRGLCPWEPKYHYFGNTNMSNVQDNPRRRRCHYHQLIWKETKVHDARYVSCQSRDSEPRNAGPQSCARTHCGILFMTALLNSNAHIIKLSTLQCLVGWSFSISTVTVRGRNPSYYCLYYLPFSLMTLATDVIG